MFVRVYRVTDKFGLAGLKLAAAFADVLTAGMQDLWRTLVFGVLLIARPFVWVGSRVVRGAAQSTTRAGAGARGGLSRAGEQAMARRAARAEMAAAVIEDPLKAQNRALSVLTVLLLVALIAAVLYATGPARVAPLPVAAANTGLLFAPTPGPDATAAPNAAAQPNAVFATPVPTATPLSAALEVRGAIAYTVREAGQTDLWAVAVGSREPLRITDSPADDRDPAWSPDGRRLAYASRQDGNWELYLMDLTTGTPTRLTYDLSFQGGPGWSPDGNWLVYESYQGENLDVYLLRIDGSSPPIRLPGSADAPDFAPAWSPDGRRIAFVSWRDGNQDIYIFSLDDQSVTNLTNTRDRDENDPAWFPDTRGDLIAYSALDGGADKVFVQSTLTADSTPQVVSFGRTPDWSPDGSSLVMMVDSGASTQLTALPFNSDIVGAPIVPVPLGASSPTWTRAPLPAAFTSRGGAVLGAQTLLFIEQASRRGGDAPFTLQPLAGVIVENAALSDQVNDSFNALRAAAAGQLGWDVLGRLDDAFWSLERPPEPGEERRNWLMTGRSFALTRSSIVGFPPRFEVVRENVGVETEWRVFVRADDSSQSGELGEPLRRMPWDFASRTSGDVEAYDQGGRLRDRVPTGYYIDFTQLSADYGWSRVPAGTDWRANANSINYWLFRKTDGLSWYDAMLEIYPPGQIANFAPTVPAPPVVRTPVAPILDIVPTNPPPTPIQITGGTPAEAPPP